MNRHGMKTDLVVGLLMFCVVLGTASKAQAQSLYEQYADSRREQLDEQTAAMGRKLEKMFSQASVYQGQQSIQSAEYLANLKRAIFYATHLAVFAGYEHDFQFARDHELFQGLPATPPAGADPQQAAERSAFAGRKYARLKESAEEEIETYTDLMVQSLEACEEMVGKNNLVALEDNHANRERVGILLKSAVFRDYTAKQADLVRGWPHLASRLRVQLDLWRPRPASPNDAVIDRAITGAL